MLPIERLAAGYGEIGVLHGVSLEVRAGSLSLCSAPMALGKARCFALSWPLAASAGRVVLNNEVLNNIPAHQIVERGLVMVPEGRALFPFMTVEENLELGSYAKRARSERRQNLDRVFFAAATEGKAASVRRLAERWRATDVRDRPRADGQAGPPSSR